MMSEPSQDTVIETVSEEAGAVHSFSVGRTLREAREHSGMSVSEVSSRIKFAPRQIEALETDDFAQLPEIAFVRGFVRSYARLLVLDEEALLAALPQAITRPAPEDADVLAEVPFPNTYATRKPNIMWLGAALGVTVVLGLFVWLHDNSSDTTEQRAKIETLELPDAAPLTAETETVVPEAPAVAPVAIVQPIPPAAPASMDSNPVAQPVPQTANPPTSLAQAGRPVVSQPVVPNSIAESAKPATPPAKPLPTPSQPKPAEPKLATAQPSVAVPTGSAIIHFTFDTESWVEVKDRNGQTLMAQLNAQGTERKVRGEPPFTLLVGNSGGVRLSYNGKTIDLAPHSSAQVAHLTLE